MPFVARSRTSSHTLNASVSDVPRSTTASSRSLGITMSVSTSARSSARPSSACRMRRRPSNRNGLVTTATVRAPVCLAMRAMTGAEPVPVPPPMPAVRNTMSLSASASWIACSSSSAARRPWAGSPPEPRPRVATAPIWMRVGASDWLSAWRSVLAEMKSTPRSPAPIMRFTALPPAPPQPITFSRAEAVDSSSSSNEVMSTSPCAFPDPLAAAVPPLPGAG